MECLKHTKRRAPELIRWPGSRTSWIEERERLVAENEQLATEIKILRKTHKDLQGRLENENLPTNPQHPPKGSADNQCGPSEPEHPFIAMSRGLSPDGVTERYREVDQDRREKLREEREKLEDMRNASWEAHRERLTQFDYTYGYCNEGQCREFLRERRELCRRDGEEYKEFQRAEKELVRKSSREYDMLHAAYIKAHDMACEKCRK